MKYVYPLLTYMYEIQTPQPIRQRTKMLVKIFQITRYFTHLLSQVEKRTKSRNCKQGEQSETIAKKDYFSILKKRNEKKRERKQESIKETRRKF